MYVPLIVHSGLIMGVGDSSGLASIGYNCRVFVGTGVQDMGKSATVIFLERGESQLQIGDSPGISRCVIGYDWVPVPNLHNSEKWLSTLHPLPDTKE